MKTFFVLFACSVISFNFVASASDDDWNLFKKTYNKNYANDPTEENKRKNIFFSNSAIIQEHNKIFEKGEVTFKMGMNEFGDLVHEEFLKLFNVRDGRCPGTYNNANVDTVNDVPVYDDYDKKHYSRTTCSWTELEVVNTVHHQRMGCKSGWAYSAADAMRGRKYIRSKREKSYPSLSAQYLIDCSKKMGNCGCENGNASNACRLVKRTNKMPYNSSYTANHCAVNDMKDTVSFKIKGCQERTVDNNPSLVTQSLCKDGPMSAFLSVEQPSFQFAKEGIYYEKNCDVTPNHEVLLVGYNDTGEQPAYWIVKNSFGTSWGENGFLKIAAKPSDNGCKILSKVSYPQFHT